MPKFNNNKLIARFQDFRQKIYNCFESCSDACMDLLDALAGNTGANSIAELSLSPLFPRSYNSIYKAIKASFNTNIQEKNNEVEEKEEKEQEEPNKLIRVVSELIDQPQQRPFYLFATDTTPHPRPYAKTLAERGYIYQPNTIKGNKPINIGHCYSILSILPEKETDSHVAWAIPFSGERVSLDQSGVDVASEQIQSVMSDTSLTLHEKLCVLVGDTAYSERSFLCEQSKHKNLVVIARVRSNRIFYKSPLVDKSKKKPGCQKKYGERFDLGDAETWHEPDETTQTQQTTRKGRLLNITILAWHQMLMRGTKEQKMYRHPFTLIRVDVTDDTGNSVWKPMWLIVIGDRCQEISPLVAYQSFRQRFDIEHMFRFSKQRLLMTEFQTPDVKHEENWIRLVMLAYVQLWAAKDLATHLPRPWERYLKPHNDNKIVTPSVVQRDFQTIISETGKPGHSPKPRGNSLGRVAGHSQPKRSKHPVVKKQSKSTPDKQKAA
ncbi:NF041680 family putative transposase [Nostoc commune]|uniref:NF041680 family putative transposase n=1 Tax=Nostoc commune TaxID=1178 RepID=UPI0018C6DDCB|nr:NF041680 family putative transposase [Nostoc commune]MBG1260876.1 transposase [Nostoc commune BAE]